ncbi:PHP domain-containing protein, partial [Acinetobacter sp. 163]|nr:PHP domain-containing protein [Acinetobacter sp. 163]
KQNYHSHTKRCGHAVGEDEDYVREAIKAGLEVLGFSDHAAYPIPCPSERMNLDQVEDYMQSITALKEKYADDIKILLGME